MKKFGIDHVEVDAANIIEDNDKHLVVSAIIAREGVFPYPEGMAFKPGDELRKATYTADAAWIVAEKHPDTLILMDPVEIKGRVEDPRFVDNQKIKANLKFFKDRNTPGFLNDIREGNRKGVSIGFFYEFDATPGEWNGKHYDFIQRNILLDHVAAGVPRPRCAPPLCGIAIDSELQKFATDPFAEYKDFDDCVAKNQDKDNPEAYCAEIKRKTEGAADQDEEGDLEKKREAAKERCGKYPVSFKEGKGNLTKPEEYADIPEDQFADPCNFKYPMQPDDRLMNAWARLNVEENRVKGGYSSEEWAWMKNRVKKKMEAKGHEVTAECTPCLEKAAADEIKRAKRLLPYFR